MTVIDRNLLVAALQSKVDSLSSSSSLDEMIRLSNAIANLNEGYMCYVNTLSDLPSLINDEYPIGSVLYVKNKRLMLISASDGWYTLDNRRIKADGLTLWGWGRNDSGIFGSTSRSSPILIPVNTTLGAANNKGIGASSSNIFCIDKLGTIHAWGKAYLNGTNTSGAASIESPAAVVGGITWSQVTAGGNPSIATLHAFAISSSGTLWGWGYNGLGSLGVNDGTAWSTSSPIAVVGGFTWKQVAAGSYYGAAIKIDDTLWTWGRNNYGQLGDNTNVNKSSPISVVGGFTWKSVSSGYYFISAIRSDNTIWSWGKNEYGQLGNNDGTVSSNSSPVSVVGGFTWKQVSAGHTHNMAIKSDDTIWTWGRNNYGQLGNNDGTVSSNSSPVSVVGGFTWKSIGAGRGHCAAIKSDDTLWTWGKNNYGQLGDNTTTSRSSPVSVVGGFTWGTVNVTACMDSTVATRKEVFLL